MNNKKILIISVLLLILILGGITFGMYKYLNTVPDNYIAVFNELRCLLWMK